jgi:hypothetical protein
LIVSIRAAAAPCNGPFHLRDLNGVHFDFAPHLQQRLHAELEPGESLTWVGQPKPARRLKSGFGGWLFFLPWTVIAVISIEDILSPLGLFFLLVGVIGLSSPFWLRRKASSTIYAITLQRSERVTPQGEFDYLRDHLATFGTSS